MKLSECKKYLSLWGFSHFFVTHYFFTTHPLAPSAREGGRKVGNFARDRKHCENARRAMSLQTSRKAKCSSALKKCLCIFGLCNDGENSPAFASGGFKNSPSLAEGVRGG